MKAENIVNTASIAEEFDRVVSMAYEKGRVFGYSKAKEEMFEFSEEEKEMIRFSLDYLHDADLSDFGKKNVETLENIMLKMGMSYTSQVEEDTEYN